jgi:predicted metal-dependent HD superfamily phosphohydrolase
MSLESKIVIKTRLFVEELMQKNWPEDLCYHNLQNTSEVARASTEIGVKSGLNVEQLEIVILAAWLHDSGYQGGQKDHETESQKIASKFLTQHKYPSENLEKVLGAIEATRIPQSPHTIIEEVLCDADMFHLSIDEFKLKSNLLRKELEFHRNRNIGDKEWLDETLNFVKNHEYFTNYGKQVLEPRKARNITELEN